MPIQPQFSTSTLSSFHQWLDNWIAHRGQAYTNVSTPLYYQPDGRLPGYVAYASPFRSWVCDSGVAGATIGGTISGSLGIGGTGTLTRGQSGMVVDYENGRVLFPAAVGTKAIISGSYAFKDFNIYKANETQEGMVFENKYYLNSRFGNPMTGIPPPYEMVTPCMFISDSRVKNDGYALGGTYNTQMLVSVAVLAENLTQLEGALSLMADAKDTCFPQLPLSAWPVGFLGDFKGGSGYDYNAVKAQHATPGNLYNITEVKVSKVGDGAVVDETIFVGLCDFTVSRVRTIH